MFCLFQLFFFFLLSSTFTICWMGISLLFGNDILTHGNLMRFILLLRIYWHGLWYVYIYYYIATVCGFVFVVDSARATNHPYFYPSKLNSDLLGILLSARHPIYQIYFSYMMRFTRISSSLYRTNISKFIFKKNTNRISYLS